MKNLLSNILFEENVLVKIKDQDGLRFVNEGIIPGKETDYPYINQENPQLVAEVMYERERRRGIRERNIQRFT